MRLKIGITCHPNLGGSGVVATELGKALAKRGHQVHFITQSMPFRLGTFQKNVFYHEVEVNEYHVFRYPPYDVSLASKMAQVAHMQELDLLHVHYAIPHAISAYLAKKMLQDRIKIITTLHGTDITVLGHDPSLRETLTFSLQESDAITAVSKDLIAQTKDILSLNQDISLAYNFVDPSIYYPRKNAELRAEFAADHQKLLLHISNFRPVKRVPDVILIFEQVCKQVDAKLLLIGEGPDLSLIQAMIQERGLEDRVIFLGKQEEVAEIISLADVFLLPSEKESFGLVALEALACGVPVVASETGGLPEVITHGKNGFLAGIGNVKLMSEYTIQLLTNSSLHTEFVKNGLMCARGRFHSDKIVTEYEKIYQQVLLK